MYCCSALQQNHVVPGDLPWVAMQYTAGKVPPALKPHVAGVPKSCCNEFSLVILQADQMPQRTSHLQRRKYHPKHSCAALLQ
jgi:hypothetical protein